MPAAGLDENELRKVRSGRAAISARLDLHGLRQHEAHAALRAFLYRAQANGAKWALVITGKGSRSPRGSASFAGISWGRQGEASTGGILRTMVPVWLSEPEFRALVVGFRSAGRRHGGEGALYVRLRTRR
jgi:DNA-nicking Smr family endonuclease